jgi:hypothetical protein
MEKHYAFIKNNRVENITVFANQDDALAQRIVDEQGYDSFLWLDETDCPAIWSSYDGTTFTAPTPQYLFSIGVLSQDPDAPVVEPVVEPTE